MSDHLDRAAEVLWEATCPDGLRAAMRPDCWAMAQALDKAGLLVTPEHGAAVAAKALREAAEKFAAGDWADAWLTDGVDDDVSAVRSTNRWFNDRADRIERGNEGETDE